VSGLACETENRAVRAQFPVWAVKIKVRGAWGLWGEGCMLLLRWWVHAVAWEPAGKNK
jgi:hypothetical protein